MKHTGINNRFFAVSMTVALMLLAGCIQFRKLNLYDGEVTEPIPPPPASIDKVVSSVLFEDDTLDVWGILSDSCKTFALVNDVSYKGESSLKLTWDRQGCIFVGFGMGWDGYAGKDLTPIMEYAAFEMYVRSQKGKVYGLPFVLTLEDYSGVLSFCYTGNKFFERSAIDEEWQRVVVPLKYFNDEGKGIDYSNIKQLQVELQQSGAVYVDEIHLILYEEPEQEPWLVEAALPDPTRLPQALFDEGFVGGKGWGVYQYSCQDIKITEDESQSGDKSLHVKWDEEGGNCDLIAFGVNWNSWKPIDISPMRESAVLSFYLKSEDINKLKFKINLEQFDSAGRIGVDWNPDYAKATESGWYKVDIPMSDFKGELDPKRVKHLAFRLEGAGEFFIDNINWVSKQDN